MANSEYKQARWAEVLDGQRMWEKAKVCPGDDDTFRTMYVDPLKALEHEGKCDVVVITCNDRGARIPIGVKITGAINYG
jgi:hypothetical protein